ncbi:alpha/beta fold hydrolase [Telmatospirillum sp. J64-1]|uniref:alpha/beta fold hydrolase n=1 Tax=Telmatospirillum sp. J64-1 TaxID=2502183 RepID=UPI00115D20FC|nr:alpha/beta hydrolase [Telmatospirillum sp. J64-1]
MELIVNGIPAFAATGGKPFDPAKPAIVFVHGSGLDSSVWGLHTRWFVSHGFSVLALDLPGHGKSAGEPLPSIEAMADWVAAAISAAGAKEVVIVGHSMGALVALETAARHPAPVRGLGLVGAAAAIPVHPDLIASAERNDPAAFAMINLWGHGAHAELGGSRAPGVWMVGTAQRVLERNRPGVLAVDLKACDTYKIGLASAAKVECPAVLVLGERDKMTPLKAGRALAETLPKAKVTVLNGAGHMLMAEEPDAVLDALSGLADLVETA